MELLAERDRLAKLLAEVEAKILQAMLRGEIPAKPWEDEG